MRVGPRRPPEHEVAVQLCQRRVVNVGFMLYLIYVQVPKATGLSLGTAMGGGLGHAIGPLVIIFYGLNLMWMRLIIKGILKALGYSKSKGKASD